MTEPNFRAEANRLVGCKNMPDDEFAEEIMFTLTEIYQLGLKEEKINNG